MPARRAEGRTKHRLVPDPVCGPVVSETFRLRALERLTYRAIAERFNQDLDKYPPPVANKSTVTVGRWPVQSVRGNLENPKYTGYQVWNRKARKKRGNKGNPVSEWIWSPRPVHENPSRIRIGGVRPGLTYEWSRGREDRGMTTGPRFGVRAV
ncbi:recombinase family protein [Streptomyces sp. V2I9]|uniref:recombinase family protein n=1 Tax=Streptomyces sp. V2I9 TaxID=3042304 RepID=UPI00278AC258|nr:recombinase family protein [Streptomyces sp. V2I9]MDQ0987930.1 hypothetical protein [Streptomyces sp. V2I9]